MIRDTKFNFVLFYIFTEHSLARCCASIEFCNSAKLNPANNPIYGLLLDWLLIELTSFRLAYLEGPVELLVIPPLFSFLTITGLRSCCTAKRDNKKNQNHQLNTASLENPRTNPRIFTITSHSTSQALLQTTILASIPMVFRHFAIHLATTLVSQLFPDRAFEKTFTTLTGNCSIMSSGGAIATYETEFNVVRLQYLTVH